jgi:dTDP-4-amino-4,6-dideoxygalactose transaminase
MASNHRPRIIGGMFGLPGELRCHDSHPPFLKGDDICLVNARSGIFLLCKLLTPTTVWVPSYLCGAMLQPVEMTQTRSRFYEVTYNLTVPSGEWLKDVQRGDLVVVIDYFGFPADRSVASHVKEKGAWVLEDACQALLTGQVGKLSDFVVFSPRKFLGVPEGGILTLNRATPLDGVNLEPPPAVWWLKTLNANIMRREFDLHGGDHRWFQLYQETERESPVGYYSMSELAKTLLLHAFDYSVIAQRRISNYHVLANELGEFALFPELPAKVVPLGFPIRLRNRDEVRQRLFENQIYPPVHWPVQGIVPEEFKASHRLAASIMTLPCDQRYDNDDMTRMARLVLEGVRL